jgi:hypothetical protein|tara:strand:+ start:372 stop:509 length:138 start_codon:yes stop_codon:yes gene_type:complete
MIDILHNQIKIQEILINEKNLLIKELKEQIEIKDKIIKLQDRKIN